MSKTTLFKAFPLGNQVSAWQDGMDLRDYFAAKAMQGFCANISRDLSLNIGHFANLSYKVADAMMEARYDTK
jgi:hypothetical protein